MSTIPQPDPRRWSAGTVGALRAAGLEPAAVAAVLAAALAEDFADGPDVTTSATVPADVRGSGAVVPRQDGVLCGAAVAAAVFETVAGADPVTVRILVADGSRISAGRSVLDFSGPVSALLSAERTALNLIGHLSGVATATRRWVDAVVGSDARIRDTRKTLPGLRALEKYAVRCGGGVNHRMSLGDAVLIKDNHVAAAGSVTAAIDAVRAQRPDLPMEVEVDDLTQFDQALAAGPELILLDNFSLADTAEAVRRRNARAADGSGTRLEASGGLSLDRAAAVAATGVDFLAVGALTHSAPVLDLGLDLEAEQVGTSRAASHRQRGTR